jgi:regulator of RNase E activity RraA
LNKILLLLGTAMLLLSLRPGAAEERAAISDASLLEGFRQVEVASVADAMEQLYGQRAYMSHALRPLAPSKYAGFAVTVQLKKEENREGSKALQGMLDAIDTGEPGSVYVMSLQDGEDFAGIGGLMSTALKSRGFVGAVVDGGVRDLPQIQKLQFPVFSRSIVPSTTVNHFRFAGANITVICGGVPVAAGDVIVADLDGVVSVPRAKAAEVLRKAQELDFSEHSMIPYIEKFRSINKAVQQFGRL